MNNTSSPQNLRKLAMDFLARREHTEQELRRKLNARNDDGEAVDEVIEQLKAEHLQSDERFAEAYVNHRFNAGVGPRKIRHELRQKGIDELLADSYIEPLADEWEEMMHQQRARKFGETLPADYNARMKQARFLQNRGFSPESVMRLFR